MSLIPENINNFYSECNNNSLFQGDIISAKKTHFVEDDVDGIYPDYFIIITKSCDLVFRTGCIEVKGIIQTLPLISFNLARKIFKRDFESLQKSYRKRVLTLAVMKFSEVRNYITNSDQINSIIDNKMSRFMFLPPDGKVLKEPMIIDFDYILPIDGRIEENVKELMKGKQLQLSSPFREQYSQNFGKHFSQIGINDSEIKDKTYRATVKEHYNASKPS